MKKNKKFVRLTNLKTILNKFSKANEKSKTENDEKN